MQFLGTEHGSVWNFVTLNFASRAGYENARIAKLDRKIRVGYNSTTRSCSFSGSGTRNRLMSTLGDVLTRSLEFTPSHIRHLHCRFSPRSTSLISLKFSPECPAIQGSVAAQNPLSCQVTPSRRSQATRPGRNELDGMEIE
jgi:hypothetical protein